MSSIMETLHSVNPHWRESLRQRMKRFYETSEIYKGLLAHHDETYQQTYVELVNRYALPG